MKQVICNISNRNTLLRKKDSFESYHSKMVSEAGLEPARPFSQSLAPQASASANSATPTLVARNVYYHALTM